MSALPINFHVPLNPKRYSVGGATFLLTSRYPGTSQISFDLFTRLRLFHYTTLQFCSILKITLTGTHSLVNPSSSPSLFGP